MCVIGWHAHCIRKLVAYDFDDIWGQLCICIRKIQHSNANIHTYQSAATLAGGNYALETIKFLKQCFGILLHTLAN